MYAVRITDDANEMAFRQIAKRCLSLGISPCDVAFIDAEELSLLPSLPDGGDVRCFNVPRALSELMRDAICHSARDRFALLYNVLWRTLRGQQNLIFNPADSVVARLNDYARNVRRDIHKMHAFLRFRRREVDGRTIFVAWFEPQHFILSRAVPFFVDRFANMEWCIGTPIGSAAWNGIELAFGEPTQMPPEENDAVLDEFWLAYYRATFDPARVRLKAMAKEMPRHYWSTMPETALIPSMVAEADGRVSAMNARAPDCPPRFADKIVPRKPGSELSQTPLDEVKMEVAVCRRCPLHSAATQAVFGEGPADARVLFVGEQPGDQEDLAGRPFVGPAGQVFDRALVEAGLDRDEVYITNAVKHFKYEPRGKRRIHSKPNSSEVSACRWWLDREIAALKPELIVALGGTAANALAQRVVSVTRERGPMAFGALRGFVTVHPSFLLRLPDDDRKTEEYRKFVVDLRRIRLMAEHPTKLDPGSALGARAASFKSRA